MKRTWPLLVIALVAALNSGCETAGRPAGRPAAQVGEGRLVVTLNGPDRSPINLTVELAGLALHARGGGWFQVPVASTTLNSIELVRRQVPLVDASLPTGQYDRLTLRFDKAFLRQEGKVVDLSVRPEGFSFDVAVEVEAGGVASLFVVWDVDHAVENDAFLAPAFSFEGKEPEVRGVVAYVTNEESGTVSVIDRAKDRVVATIQVGRAPRAIAVDPDQRWAFVLNGGEDTITVIDVNTQRVLHTLNIEARGRAEDLAVSSRGQRIFISNSALNTVTVLDANSFSVLATIPVGIAPVGIAADAGGTRVFVANRGSNGVTLIDPFTNRVLVTLAVEAGPIHVSVDPNPSVDRAYVASPPSAFMTVLSVTSGQVVQRLTVGPGAVASLSDPIQGRLFVLKHNQNRVVVFDRARNVEIGGIPVGRGPHRIALDADRDKLYVVNRDGGSVTVVDRVSRRVEATIPVGKRPSAIAIVTR